MSIPRLNSAAPLEASAVQTVVTRWWWVRHAPVATSALKSPDEIVGQHDLPADCSDRPTLAALAGHLPRSALWVTSALQRARQTATALAPMASVPLVEPDFAEQDFGLWQGQGHDALAARGDVAYSRFWQNPAETPPPEGESFAALMRRAATAVARLNGAYGGRDIVAVAHAGTIRAGLAQALDLRPLAALAFEIAPCSLTRIDHVRAGGQESWRVGLVNFRPQPFYPA